MITDDLVERMKDIEALKAIVHDAAWLCHSISRDHGFWDEPRNKGEMIALMHSELSEMLEAVRKPGPDHHCPEFTNEEVEMADLIIRALDYTAGHNLRLFDAMRAKIEFNRSRPMKHGKAF